MRIKQLLLAIVCILSVYQLDAQTSKITGAVKADDETPIEFANVILTASNTNTINGVTSNADGTFELAAVSNKYKLTVSILGYETYTSDIDVNANDINLGTITLKADALQLGEAVVTAKLIDRRADRYVMNIQGSSTSAGKNTMELLALAPSVWVDKQKGISINGKTDIKVMINDRVVNMTTDELNNYLETIKAEDIQSIEIITDPGAEYEANSNSGIIHIKLRKGYKSGLTGSLNLNIRSFKDDIKLSPSINFSYRRNKLSITGLVSNYNSIWENDSESSTDYYNQNSKVLTNEIGNSKSKNWRINLGAVYELTDKHEIGLTFEPRFNNYYAESNYESQIFNNSLLEKKTRSTNTDDWIRESYDVGLNYKFKTDTLGSYLKVFLDYSNNKMTDDYLWNVFFNDNTIADSIYRPFIGNNADIYSARADYRKKINDKTSVSFGGLFRYNDIFYKSRHEDYMNGAWVENPSYTDNFDYNEYVTALYGKFDSKWKKLSYTLGLRYENTTLRFAGYKRSYNDVFPSVYLKYGINEDKGHSVNVSYNRKLSRPYYGQLNPFKEWFEEYSYSTGNPYLKPTYSDALSLGATLFDKFVFTAQYTAYTDVVDYIAKAAPEPNTSMQTPENIDKMKMYYVSLYAPVKVNSWYNFTVDLNVSKREYEMEILKNQKWVFRARTQHTFTLPKNWTISIDGWYSSKSAYSNAEYEAMGGINGSINKKFWDNKFSVTLQCWNIQGFRHANVRFNGDDYFRNLRLLNQARIINLTFTYNFSVGKKVTVKQAEKGMDEDRMGSK